MNRLDLVVGPNGAGKSTFVRLTLSKALARTGVVNADLIAQQRWPDDPEVHSYEAARIATATREALMARREAFIAETVFSHPSKLDLLRRATSLPELNATLQVRLPTEGIPEFPSDQVAHRPEQYAANRADVLT